jgi:hypothetical protein
VRIIVASPPRFGNHWVRCLLGSVYGLEHRAGADKPARSAREFGDDVEAGDFPDGSIIHIHARYNRRLVGQFEELPAHIVTVVRDPYDAFVSYYEWVQSRYANRVRKEGDPGGLGDRPRHAMFDRDIDDPAVLGYLREGYGPVLQRAVGWLHSGRAAVVRFERLNADPAAELARLTERIEPVSPERIAAAVEYCRLENVKQRQLNLANTVRHGRVGESHARLGEEHLRIMREAHGDLVRSLGYPVR